MTEPGRGALTPLAVLVLSLLNERRMHPYEMVQTLNARQEDRFANIRPGSLYHTVDRLVELGFISIADVERDGNRPERTVYAITDSGRLSVIERVEHMLSVGKPEFPELYLGLAEAHELPRQRVVELLRQRVASMRADYDELTARCRELHDDGTHEMFYLDMGCRMATLGAQIAWLDGLIGDLVERRLAWLDDVGFSHPEVDGDLSTSSLS